jgi:transposase InsO family protein
MKNLLLLLAHLLTTLARIIKPGGARAVVAENLLLKQQLLVLNRSRHRAPNLRALERVLFGFWALFLSPHRIRRAAVVLQPSSLLRFHAALKQHKYRLLFSPRKGGAPGPKGPARELIQAIVGLKQRNPRFGCPRIAQQLAKTFGAEIDKDVVRRVLAAHYRPEPHHGGPSWLTFLGHTKDSLWSLDLFRTESILVKTHWVLVVMDQFSRRIIGFGVQAGDVDGSALCRMFNQAICSRGFPVRLSFDHDPLFAFHRWQANLRILGIESVRSVPYVAVSHPFVERLIGTVRREYLDRMFFWNRVDLERKLEVFATYYNAFRVHQGLGGRTPEDAAGGATSPSASLRNYSWQTHCNGLFELPIAA